MNVKKNYYLFLESIAFISFICILISSIIASLSLELAFIIIHSSDLLILTIIILDALIKLGIKDLMKFFISAFIIGSIMEIFGVLYGIPFGKYHYTEVIGLKIFGLVPLAIPINWFLITYIAFNITNWITNSVKYKYNVRSIIALSTLDGLIATSWDLIVDPIMVHIIKAWVWETRDCIYGIPISNFIGWFIVSFIITLTYRIILLREGKYIDLTHLPSFIYFQLWLIMVVVALINNRLDLIIIGTLAMNIVLLCYVLKIIKKDLNYKH